MNTLLLGLFENGESQFTNAGNYSTMSPSSRKGSLPSSQASRIKINLEEPSSSFDVFDLHSGGFEDSSAKKSDDQYRVLEPFMEEEPFDLEATGVRILEDGTLFMPDEHSMRDFELLAQEEQDPSRVTPSKQCQTKKLATNDSTPLLKETNQSVSQKEFTKQAELRVPDGDASVEQPQVPVRRQRKIRHFQADQSTVLPMRQNGYI